MWRNLLIKAQIVTRHGGSKKRIDLMTLDERPLGFVDKGYPELD
jgi:hypothetical protein